jgi:hypothetical protein
VIIFVLNNDQWKPPQRLSNEFDETTGAAPAMAPEVAGGEVLSNGVALGGEAGAAVVAGAAT